jgi:hypothetical protein
MVGRAHVSNDKNYLFMHKHHMIQQTPSHTSKGVAIVISRYKLHGLVEFKILLITNASCLTWKTLN